jgi:hypothetical protein
MIINLICHTENCISQNEVYVVEVESLDYYKAYCGGCELEITDIVEVTE